MQVCWIYVSEIPTARLRGLNVSLAAATQWLFNLVIARAVPNMLVTMGAGGYGAFITFACFCLGMFIFVWFLVPETKVRRSHAASRARSLANTRFNRAWLLRRWTSSSASLSWPSRWMTRRGTPSMSPLRRTAPELSRSRSALPSKNSILVVMMERRPVFIP